MSLQGGYIRSGVCRCRAAIYDAIKQVRQKHDGLKGVPMSQVISDASKIIGPVGTTVSLVLFPTSHPQCSVWTYAICSVRRLAL